MDRKSKRERERREREENDRKSRGKRSLSSKFMKRDGLISNFSNSATPSYDQKLGDFHAGSVISELDCNEAAAPSATLRAPRPTANKLSMI